MRFEMGDNPGIHSTFATKYQIPALIPDVQRYTENTHTHTLTRAADDFIVRQNQLNTLDQWESVSQRSCCSIMFLDGSFTE